MMTALEPSESCAIRRTTTETMRNEPESGGVARRLVAKCLADWGAAAVVDDAQLIVSELVANVHRHTGCRYLAVLVRVDGPLVRIAVRDSSRTLPVVIHSGTKETSGRGIALVAALAHCWGTEEASYGKWVWAELRL